MLPNTGEQRGTWDGSLGGAESSYGSDPPGFASPSAGLQRYFFPVESPPKGDKVHMALGLHDCT